MGALREERLAAAFIDLADIVSEDFDIMEFLHRLADHAVALLELTDCGAMLLSAQGQVVDATASTEATRHLELAQIQLRQGPCWDCIHTGAPTADTLLDSPTAGRKWPRFAPLALACGFVGIAAVPMRLRGQTVGALNLFHAHTTPMTTADLRLGQALADAAAIAILTQRSLHDQRLLSEQLQAALDSRVVIEQAKGVLATRAGISLDEAFDRMRRHARHHRQRLTQLALHVIEDPAEHLTGPLS
ncbi:GAF and ANTAR domain-containing protein [Streptomyces sp. NRRL B-1347]|uniref:GAF and ANTAR domain-containing protein n=1 Tax=Streptomyces sp. NRRL B-1347 TaxID=1476877 RepID=UPI0004C89C84|nr:GAF and ANTAR domain-containing protein [Streptomyces sp. NRRL B-1347]